MTLSNIKLTPKNYVEVTNQIIHEGIKTGVLHLSHSSSEWQGKHFHINNQDLVNLGTCGYLGLETDQRLIDGAIDFVQRYGTQFSISRSYVYSEEVKKLEHKLGKMFDNSNVLIASSTTLMHQCVLPLVINPETDAVVVDHQAHFSIQSALQTLAIRQTNIQKVKHNDMKSLEEKLTKLKEKYERIWYAIDGVYSMYGDFAPIEDLNRLMDKFPELHLYVDDAHGVGWYGKNGTGCAFYQTKNRDRLVLSTTLAKGFGATGGIAVFPNKKHYEQVVTFGGPLSYSHPLAPPILGAANAACDIFLSEEIIDMQNQLKEKIEYCNSLLEELVFPIMSNPESPIKNIGIGNPSAVYELCKRVINDGYYCTPATFPALPINAGGLRFTINGHITKEEIKGFVETVKKHYWDVLELEGVSLNEARAKFDLGAIKV